jgi:hypothetical protein
MPSSYQRGTPIRPVVDQEVGIVMLGKIERGVGIQQDDEIGTRRRVQVGQLLAIGERTVIFFAVKKVHVVG